MEIIIRGSAQDIAALWECLQHQDDRADGDAAAPEIVVHGFTVDGEENTLEKGVRL